jgi:hypothetical protein
LVAPIGYRRCNRHGGRLPTFERQNENLSTDWYSDALAIGKKCVILFSQFETSSGALPDKLN